MLTWVKHFLAPPVFEGDEDKTRRAGLLNIVLNAFTVALIAVLVGDLFSATPIMAYVVVLLNVAVIQVFRWLMWRGWVKLSALMLVVVVSGSVTAVIYFFVGTIRAPAASFYVLTILAAGLLVGGRAMLGLIVLNSLSLSVLIFAERSGWLPPADLTVGMTQWVTFTVVFSLTGAFLNLAMRAIAEALVYARRELVERQRVEGALRASEERFGKAFHTSPDAIIINRLDGRGVLEVNVGFVDMTGYTRDEVVGKSTRQLGLWVNLSDAEHMAALLRDQGEVRNMECEFRRKDGSIVMGQLNANLIEIGGEAFSITIVRDVTARKRVEAEREALIEELEAKNAELERFTYTVSHDLKSPLITIQGFLGYLERDARTGNFGRFQADLARISDATGKMKHLLEELLELSRIGRKMNPPEEVPFEAVARAAVELVAGRIAERGVRVEIADGLPTVYGDRARLVEVVQNLVDNAVKFMGDQPAPRIEIGVRAADRDGLPVFYVCDNGMGIDPKYCEKVFGLFDKLDAQSEGTGVGLALVKRIVEAHGGRIWVESDGPGTGSAFCFTLPNKQGALGQPG